MPRNPGHPLHHFKKGFDPSRNIKGRPKAGQALPELIRAAFERYDANGITEQERVIKLALERAKKGSYQLLGMLWDRGYGKVPDQIQLKEEPLSDLSKLTNDELVIFKELLEKTKL